MCMIKECFSSLRQTQRLHIRSSVGFKTQTDGYNRNLTEHNVTWVVHVLFVNLTRDLQRKRCDFRSKENETKTDKSKLIKAFSVMQYETIITCGFLGNC